MSRETHVRFCERAVVKFHRATRLIILSERHLRRVLSSYFQYHHDARTHLSLNKDCPRPRPVQLPSTGNNIIAFSEVGGLHNRRHHEGHCVTGGRKVRSHAAAGAAITGEWVTAMLPPRPPKPPPPRPLKPPPPPPPHSEHADLRLRGDTRRRDGGVRQELVTGMSGTPTRTRLGIGSGASELEGFRLGAVTSAETIAGPTRDF
jgi:hypothetical protein